MPDPNENAFIGLAFVPLARADHGGTVPSESLSSLQASPFLVVMTVGPAGDHTDEQVIRQRQLLTHNLQEARLCIHHRRWD